MNAEDKNKRMKEELTHMRLHNLYTKLGTQAGLLAEEYNGFDRTNLSVSEKKLVELTVRECAEFVQFYYKDHACEMIAYDLKNHFGIV